MATTEPREPTLAEFFEGMSAYFSGDRGLNDLRTAWGELPAAPGRVEFYRTLVQGNWNRVLDKLYPATRRAVGHASGPTRPNAWTDLKRAYCQQFRPSDWDLNALGEDLRTFLESQAEQWPAYVVELADFEWIKYATWRADTRIDLGTQRFNPTAVARHYTHRVHDFASQPDLDVPEAAPVTLVVYRHPQTHVARVHQPTLYQMLLLGVAQGELPREAAWEHARHVGATQDDWNTARSALRRMGLLGTDS